ncbi:MAG: lipopolysaccharide biosynthesis protein [Thermoanaerobacteraceae bacterium]|nr:lipopolysaccharide biosynthesis protein [Thermoanaerobacteraceae bacterium]
MKLSNIKSALKDFITNPGEGLYQRTIRSGVWVFSLRMLEQVLGVIRLIILARILSPNNFGLMGIALLAMSALETFSQTGFAQALIQKKEKTEEYLDAAWTFMLIRNIALFAILFLGAPYIAYFFEAPEASLLMRVIGISLLFGSSGGIGGFANIGILYFQKELEFNKQFIYRSTGTLADFVVAVSSAIILKSVWALVFGLLAGNIVRFFVGYLIHPYRPRLNFDFDKARELFGFGKWILGSSILVFLLNQGDDILVGKLLGATMLGFYQMAYRISNMPATEITHVISQVTFPAYSKLQDNIPKLREAYLKTLQLTAFISIPLAGGIFILAPDFTKIFLGEQWMPMVPAMRALAIWGLSRSISSSTGSLFQAIGKPELSTKLQLLRFLILGALIYPFTILLGILGTSLAVVLSALFVDPIAVYWALKAVHCNVFKFGKAIILPLIQTIIMLSILFPLKMLLFNSDKLSCFLLISGIGVLIYVLIAKIFELRF